MATIMRNNTFVQRLIGAAALDSAIYEEVESDQNATSQAILVVLGSSVAAGVGMRPIDEHTVSSVLLFSVIALISWAAWALLTYEIGTRLMPGPATRADVGELLRTIGFAATPGLLRFLGIMPAVLLPVFAVTAVWMLVAMVVAVRQALDYRSTGRAVAVCVLGWLLSLTIAVVMGVVFGPSVS
jgi:hypothetical protein